MNDAQPISHNGRNADGVLVIHGFTSTPGSMRAITEAAMQAGYHVETPLLPGHGTKWQDMAKVRYQDWIHEVDLAYQRLQQRCSRIHICGLSLGGALGIYIASHYPQTASLTLINNGLYMTDFISKFAWIARYFIPKIKGLSGDIKKQGVTEPAYDFYPASAGHEAIKFFKQAKKSLPKVTCPVIIFKSAQDHIIPVEVAEYTYAFIGSENKKLIYLNDSYHVATMDNEAEIIVAVFLHFIKELP